MGLAIVSKHKTEECLPIVFMGTIVVLYIFYCLNFLHVGRFFVYAVLLELIIMGAILLFKSDDLKKSFFRDYFTPALAIFIGLAIAVIIFSNGLRPSLWDELRLWGASPKAMFYIGKLQIGNNAVLYPEMQSYPPGMPLLGYFFISLSGSYLDSTPFISMILFGFALIISALKKVSWKMWPLIAPIVAIIVIMPCVLTFGASEMGGDLAYYYVTLFIDMILGTVAGYALFLSVNKPFDSWFKIIRFALVLFVMPCIKNTGTLFGGVIFLIALAIVLFDTKRKVIKEKVIAMVVCALAIIVSYCSWQLLINTQGSGEYADIFAFTISKSTIGTFNEVLLSWGKIPLIIFFFAFIIIDLLITFIAKDIEKKSMLIVMIGFFVVSVIFYIGYLNTFSDYFASILRYSSLLLFMLYTYLFMRFISSLKTFELARVKALSGEFYVNRFITRLILIAVSIALVITTFVAFGLWKKNFSANKKLSSAKKIVECMNQKILMDERADNFSIKSPAKVYIVLKGPYRKSSLLHETCLYESIGTLAYVKNVCYDNAIMSSNQEELDLYEKAAEHDKQAIAKLSQLLKNRLINEEYDYIFIDDTEGTDEEIIKGVLGSEGSIEPQTLFSLK